MRALYKKPNRCARVCYQPWLLSVEAVLLEAVLVGLATAERMAAEGAGIVAAAEAGIAVEAGIAAEAGSVAAGCGRSALIGPCRPRPGHMTCPHLSTHWTRPWITPCTKKLS